MKTIDYPLAGLLLLSGCNGAPPGPTAAATERAFALTWEHDLGMERESRPTVHWMAGCTPNLPGIYVDGCGDGTATPAGGIELSWYGTTISATDWPSMLYSWHGYLMTGNFPEYAQADYDTIAKLKNDLIAAGL